MELKFLSSIILILIVIYIFSFALIANHYPSYEKMIEKHSNDVSLAKKITPKLLDYFKNGEIPSEFSFDEKKHLKDVKLLFNCMFYCLIAAFILLLFVFDSKALFYGSLIGLIFPIVLYIMPFEFLFNVFHQIFFEQGSWLFSLDSILIKMYPFEFFYGFFINILLRGWIISALLFILACVRRF